MPNTRENHGQALEITDIEMHVIYGFTLEPSEEVGWGGDEVARNTWSSAYQLRSIHDTVRSFRETGGSVTITKQPECRRWKGGKQSKASDPVRVKVSERKDGAGTLRLVFNLPQRDGLYQTSDVLHLMNILPRTSMGGYCRASIENDVSLFEKRPINEVLDDYLDGSAAKRAKEMSLPFRLFCSSMLDLYQPRWREVRQKEEPRGLGSPLYNGLEDSVEPQIPYMFIQLRVTPTQYREAFLEDWHGNKTQRRERKRFSKEIAAILGRWFSDRTIPFASNEYWNQRGLMTSGFFPSQYMNSLVFTTFSGLVTLSIVSDHSGEQDEDDLWTYKNVEATTRGSILRCLEFSRMRWHHAIWLNHKIDQLVEMVGRANDIHDLPELLKLHSALLSSSALHQQDPNSYVWDGSVGARLATFLHENAVEKVEGEINEKHRQVAAVIDARLREVKGKELARLTLDLRSSSE